MTTIGCPKEIKNQEYRVGLTPAATLEATSAGHEVLIEAGAGAGAGFPDDHYTTAGARIVDTADEVFASADLIVKVKEPQPAERARLREGQVLFTCYLLEASQGGASEGVPQELVTHLGKLLDGLSFRSIGFAMLRSGVSPGRPISLSVDSAQNVRFELKFEPIAFDPASGTVSVQRCSVFMTERTAAGGPNSMLTTDTVFRGGEYTVLGATGQASKPVFFVVHTKPVN